YIVISLLLLYFPLLPDLALLKKYYQKTKPKLSRFYGRLSLNWSGSPVQTKLQSRAMQIICIMIIPVGLLLQTIDAWLFSTTYRVGWDSTNFAPYFISGAFVAGVAALVSVIYVVRKVRRLENYITEFHFDKMGRFLALACMIYLYFNINEYLIPAFTSKKAESIHLETLFTGAYALPFWLVTIGGLLVPALILLFKKGRKPKTMFVLSIMLVLGSWWKRYIIVTPTLLHPFLPIQGVPESWRSYFPSLHEWVITSATLAMALLIITLLVRYFPAIPIQRTADEQEEQSKEKIAEV
ncbi:MAG: polysulfide reductase, partial [Eudoraea sp.]|nr:polysulfide reductase [Eudoraea sp.]